MTDIHSERLTKQNVHQNLSQTSNFSTRISVLLSRLYVHWGNFGLEDSTLIVVALVLPSSPSLSLASQTLSGVWLARLPSLGPFHEIEGGRSTAAAHAQNLVRSETKSKVVQKKICPDQALALTTTIECSSHVISTWFSVIYLTRIRSP